MMRKDSPSLPSPNYQRLTMRHAILVIFAGTFIGCAAPSAGAGEDPLKALPPLETNESLEAATPSPPRGTPGPHAEPVPPPAAEHAALLAAYRGEPFTDPPSSEAVAKAMDRVRN